MDSAPQLEVLLHRLAECPAEFLLPPDEIDVVALVCDFLRDLRGQILSEARSIQLRFLAAPHQSIVAMAVWFLSYPWFLAHPDWSPTIEAFLFAPELKVLSQLVAAEAIVNDPDRREEFVRKCLAALGQKPANENDEQFADRLNTLDSVERERVIKETRQAEARARQVREAMVRKAAQEAAARYSPE